MNDSTKMTGMKGRITRLSIQGFRSLAHVDSLELPQMALLIGANGAGKSNFIKFIEMLGWMLKGKQLQGYIERSGWADNLLYMGAKKTDKIRASVTIETPKGLNEYEFVMGHLPAANTLMLIEERYRYSNSAKGTMANWYEMDSGTKEAQLPLAIKEAPTASARTTAKTVTHLLRQCSAYQFHDTSPNAPIKQPWMVSDHARLLSHGGNLAPVLLNFYNENPRAYNTIVERIQRVLPAFDDFVLEPTGPEGRQTVALRWRGKYGDKTFGADSTSDGSLRLFCLVTLLSSPEDRLPDVIFLDEPELGLHPFAIQLVAAMMRSVSTYRQIIASTQSVTLANEFEWYNLVVVDQNQGASTFRRLKEEEVSAWLEDYRAGDLWEKNLLGGTPE